MFRILFLHELLELRLDAASGNIFPIRSCQAQTKEEFEREHASRCLDELLVVTLLTVDSCMLMTSATSRR